ncbi:MAG TPA: Fe-S-containing protein [Blastocatellia bacterium]|nr:Fe-S-containing protein [Blastocatellia bacterium]
MTQESQSQQNETREKKRSQFSDPGKKKKSSTGILIAVLVVLAAIAVYVVATSGGGKSSPDTASAQENTAEFRIPLASLSDGRAKFFSHNAGGAAVRFFVIKSSDGVYRAALDACDVCYHARKGYEQEGDEMVCRNCGQRFPSKLINEVRGGCNPIGVTRSVEADSIIIKKSDLDGLKNYF